MKKILINFLISIFILYNATDTINAQTIDEKVGQMIIVGFKGDNIKSKEFKKILKFIKNKEISGVILFSKNIKNKNDLILMIDKLKTCSDVLAFISIDNEGGYIQRFDFINFKSAKEISNLSENDARKEYSKMADVLKEIGINFNFAPCVDLAINPNSIIEKKERSYGADTKNVTKYASIMIEEHNKKNIITSIKHFPGHGSASKDTHKGIVDNTNYFDKKELEPYKNLKKYDNLNTVMISHIFNSDIDENYPASLSEKTINLLKNDIGFKGIIVSDDYDMGAIRKNYTLREIVINSINSGIDIMLFSNNIEKNDSSTAKKIHKIIKEEIKKGNIKEENINNSYKKIIELKRKLK